MKISVVIPAFNEALLLGATLENIQRAIRAFDAFGWTAEVIVCDNNSTDATAEIACAGGATVVFEPVNQIGRARNTGAAAATGDWLIFVDADSQPGFDLFTDVANQIRTGACVAGGATIRLSDRSFVADGITGLWNVSNRMGRWLAGAFIFVETATFRQIGGFSLKLFAAEELDLAVRLKAAAKSSNRKVVILHRHPLVTSARKLRLYTPKEHFRFLLRTIFNRRRMLGSAKEAHLWYDGRR
jgi:glycosyltransferase involved in cell wall biosynthesis